jgi:hypothetical protein
MGEPVPVLAVAQLLERTPAAMVKEQQARGVPVLVMRDRVLTFWDSSDYSTQVETQSAAALPGGRSQRSRYDDSQPTDAELEEIEAQMWDEHLAREAADAEAAEEREYFLDRIAADVARAESGWVRCPDVSVELDGEEDVLVVHVLRWPDLKSGLRFGTLLQANGSPGVTFAQLEFCFPHRPAVDLVRRQNESDVAVLQRIRAMVDKLKDAAEAERARRLAELDFNSPWRHSRRRWYHAEDDQLRATDRDDAAFGGPFWRHGDSRPEGAPKNWMPIDEFARGMGIASVDVVKFAAHGACRLHVFARNVEVTRWPWGAPSSAPAAVLVAEKDNPMRGSGSFRLPVNGPVALDIVDLAALCDRPVGFVATSRLFGPPYGQPGDAGDGSELTFANSEPAVFRQSDLWIGPDGQAAFLRLNLALPKLPQDCVADMTPDVEVRGGEDGKASKAGKAKAVPRRRNAKSNESRDLVLIRLMLEKVVLRRDALAQNGYRSLHALADAIVADQPNATEAMSVASGASIGQSPETFRKKLSAAKKALDAVDLTASDTTIVLGALVTLAMQDDAASTDGGKKQPHIEPGSSAKEIAKAIRGVLPTDLAAKPGLAEVELAKLVRSARKIRK